MIGDVLRDAGLPPGMLNVVTNAPADAGAVVEALIAHPAVKRINFTGSTSVGRIIAELAGWHLKPVLLELGGKAPPIALDEDVRRAMDVARRLETGICHINGPTIADEAQMPFGAVKGSGYGRFGGNAGIAEFTDLRWITIEGPQHYPF